MTDTHTTAHMPDEAAQAMPERIYAKPHGASTDVISGQRGLIGGWNEHKRDGQTEFVRADVALPHLSTPCAVEVKQLEWSQKAPPVHDHEPFTYWAAGVGGHYKSEPDGMLWFAHDAFVWEKFTSQAEAKAAAQADFERSILSFVATKPVDVAAVRRQAFEEGFENGVEQSLNALDAYDDITRNEAEQGIRKLKPDYRALSAEPAQGEQWQPIETAPKTGQFLAWSPRNGGCQMVWNAERFSKANEPFMPEHLRAEHWTHWMPLPAAPTTEAGE